MNTQIAEGGIVKITYHPIMIILNIKYCGLSCL